jgi:hypothetical protein
MYCYTITLEGVDGKLGKVPKMQKVQKLFESCWKVIPEGSGRA